MMKSRLKSLFIVFLTLCSTAQTHVYHDDLLFPSIIVPSTPRTSPRTWFTHKSNQSTLPLEIITKETQPEKNNSALIRETSNSSHNISPIQRFGHRNLRRNSSNLKNKTNFSSSNKEQFNANLRTTKRQNNKSAILNSNRTQSNQRSNRPNLKDNTKQPLKTTVLRSFPVTSFQGLEQEITNSTSNRKQNNRQKLSKIVFKKTLHNSEKSFNGSNSSYFNLFGVKRVNGSEPTSIEVDGITHPELLSELREIIRHQRQIRFKSSYQDLPVSLLAAANDDIGVKLNNDVSYFIQVDVETPTITKALAAFPQGTNTYFPPQTSHTDPIFDTHFDSIATKKDNKKITSKSFKSKPVSLSPTVNLTTIRKGIKLTSKIISSNQDRPSNTSNISFVPSSSYSSLSTTQNKSVSLTQTFLTGLTPPDRSHLSINHSNKALPHLLVTPYSRTPSSLTPKSHNPSFQTPNSPSPSSHTASSLNPSSRTPSLRTPSSHNPSFGNPNSHTPSSHTPDSHTPSLQTPNSRTPSPRTANFHTPSSHTRSSGQSSTKQAKHPNTVSSYSVVPTVSSNLVISPSSPPTYVTSPPWNSSKKSSLSRNSLNRGPSPTTHSLSISKPVPQKSSLKRNGLNRGPSPTTHFQSISKPVSPNKEVYTLAPLSLEFVKSSPTFRNPKKLGTQNNTKKPGFNLSPSFKKSQNNSIARHSQFMATIKPIINVGRLSQPNNIRIKPTTIKPIINVRRLSKPNDVRIQPSIINPIINVRRLSQPNNIRIQPSTIKPKINVQKVSKLNNVRFQPSRFTTKRGDKDLDSRFTFNDGKTRIPNNIRTPNVSLSGPIPGKPGIDYPTYQTIPKTNFDCSTKPYEGYFADEEAGCQVFHVCWGGGPNRRHARFLCPIGTLFNQRYLVCDWWNHVDCSATKEIEEAGSSPWDDQGNPRPQNNAI